MTSQTVLQIYYSTIVINAQFEPSHAMVRQKSELAAVKAAYETASSLDLTGVRSEVLDLKLSPREKEWYLVSKFDLYSVNKVSQALREIPDSITDS